MRKLAPTILKSLIEKIEIYHVEGTGKNKNQKIVIYYKFIDETDVHKNIKSTENVKLNARNGVEIEYLVFRK